MARHESLILHSNQSNLLPSTKFYAWDSEYKAEDSCSVWLVFLMKYWLYKGSVFVQSLSYVWLFATPWPAACQASRSFTIFQSLFKLISIESVMPSSHLILCHPLLLLPSVFLSIRALSSESALCIRWPKYWSFSFSIIPINEYSGSLGYHWQLLAVEGVASLFASWGIQGTCGVLDSSALWGNSDPAIADDCILDSWVFHSGP